MNLLNFCWLILFFQLGVQAASAQTFNAQSNAQPNTQSRSDLSFLSSFDTPSHSEVFFEYETYTSASKPSYATSTQVYESNFLLNLRPRFSGNLGLANYKVDSLFTFSSGDEWVYPKFSEAYIGTGPLRLGFVKENWADFEEEWRLGLYRPRFMDNKLTGGQGGIFGIHLNWNHFILSLLPVNIPELGPQFKEEDGRLVSKNPWFGEKPETLTYNGTTESIKYDVMMPPLEDLVLKPGAILSYEKLFDGWYRPRFSAAYKPMPQIVLNFPADDRFIVGSDEQYFAVEVQPLVAYHTLVSTDQEFIFNNGNSRLRASLAHEIPDLPERPHSWVTQEMSEATFLSSRVETGIGTKVFLSQLKVWGGDQPDQGRYATEKSFFEIRHFFKEAYGLGVETNFFFKKRLRSEASFIYDVAQKGGVFVTRHDLFWQKDLKISAVLEILGLVSDENPTPDGFLSRYRANDRAEIGVSYAF